MTDELKIVECPRDAMQGITTFIPTDVKVKYINALLKVGFDTIDFGSFVSPKAVPQMQDTQEVLAQLTPSDTKLLAIVANLRGAELALGQQAISYLGYPLSISETFQLNNSNKTIVQSLEDLVVLVPKCREAGKELVVYLSMGFGNPYNDPFDNDIVKQFGGILISLGVKIISIADTVGMATPRQIEEIFGVVAALDHTIEWGLHLHADPKNDEAKIKAALHAGCRRIDGAILGYGGCPFAKDELVGNLNTRKIMEIAEEMGLSHNLNHNAFTEAEAMANQVFN